MPQLPSRAEILPPCDSVVDCPKCDEDAIDASKRYILDGGDGYLSRVCRVCGATWKEATADAKRRKAPTHESEAMREVEEMLGGPSYTRPGHVDHVFARARGGQNDPSNLRLACEACNESKGAA